MKKFNCRGKSRSGQERPNKHSSPGIALWFLMISTPSKTIPGKKTHVQMYFSKIKWQTEQVKVMCSVQD
jgi:hypothetical protein